MSEAVLVSSQSYYLEITKVLQDMSTSMTALASSTNVSWPYYTQWNFPTSFGQAYLDNAGASLIAWSPIVKGDFERVEWGQYSTDHADEWMPTDKATDIPANIYSKNENGQLVPEQGDGPFVPVWEMAVAEHVFDEFFGAFAHYRCCRDLWTFGGYHRTNQPLVDSHLC
jgi:hypothetical protein